MEKIFVSKFIELFMKIIRKKFDQLNEKEIKAWQNFTTYDSSCSSPFYQYDFARLLSETNLYVAVIIGYQDDDVKFLVPFQFASGLNRLIGVAQQLGGHLSDYSGVISQHGFDKTIIVEQCLIDYMLFDHAPNSSITRQLVKELQFQEESSQVLIKGPLEEYLAQIKIKNSNFSREIAETEQQLVEKYGAIHFIFHNEYEMHLELFFKYHKKHCDELNVRDPLANENDKKLIRKLHQLQGNRLKPVLSTLYAGDTWLATHLGIEANGVIHYWFHIENKAIAHYIPAKHLLLKVIKAAFEKKLHCIDLGFGHADINKQFGNNRMNFFCNHQVPLYKGVIVGSSLKGKISRVVQSLKWRFYRS
jgi:CelD/BcsL family acetyltransferase involved in cellulose biosynthesis